MSNMQTYINEFISTNGLDESVTNSVIDLVNKCFSDYVSHMSAEWLNAEIPAKKTKKTTTPAAKVEKLENAADADSLDQLKGPSCTSVVLNDYCRSNELRIGGTKKEIAERVWRHLQGETSENDISPRSKPKKVVPSKKEQHQCFACNVKGQPCGIGATEEHNGNWFCFRHIDSADEIIEKKTPTTPTKSKVSPKAVSKKPSTSIKKQKIVDEELEEDEE